MRVYISRADQSVIKIAYGARGATAGGEIAVCIVQVLIHSIDIDIGESISGVFRLN